MTQACRLGLVIVTALSSINAAVPQKKAASLRLFLDGLTSRPHEAGPGRSSQLPAVPLA